jgi:hypothetical protein
MGDGTVELTKGSSVFVAAAVGGISAMVLLIFWYTALGSQGLTSVSLSGNGIIGWLMGLLNLTPDVNGNLRVHHLIVGIVLIVSGTIAWVGGWITDRPLLLWMGGFFKGQGITLSIEDITQHCFIANIGGGVFGCSPFIPPYFSILSSLHILAILVLGHP